MPRGRKIAARRDMAASRIASLLRGFLSGTVFVIVLCLPDGAGATTMYVARRGWHVDVGFASADVTASLEAVAAHFPHARYVFLGFGDRRYVLSAHHRGPVMLEALWPGAGVLLATGLAAPPAEAFGEVLTLDVSPEDAAAAQRAMARSLSADEGVPGPYNGSLYFTSSLRYSALHTCNTWAAEMLSAAHLPIRSRSVVFAGSLWKQVKQISREQFAARQQDAAR